MDFRIEYYFPMYPDSYFCESVYVDEHFDWELAEAWCAGRGAVLRTYYVKDLSND